MSCAPCAECRKKAEKLRPALHLIVKLIDALEEKMNVDLRLPQTAGTTAKLRLVDRAFKFVQKEMKR